MKRFLGMQDAASQAGRGLDPLTGRLLEETPSIDPRLLPRLDWPVSPALQQALSNAVSDAIAANVSLHDACDRLIGVLAGHGVVVSRDELGALLGAHSLSVS